VDTKDLTAPLTRYYTALSNRLVVFKDGQKNTRVQQTVKDSVDNQLLKYSYSSIGVKIIIHTGYHYIFSVYIFLCYF